MERHRKITGPPRMRWAALIAVIAGSLLLAGCVLAIAPPPLRHELIGRAGRDLPAEGGGSQRHHVRVASDVGGALRPPRTRPHPLARPIAALCPQSPSPRISGPRDLKVPVLMYHHVGNAPRTSAYPGLYVEPSAFVGQLRYLQAHGYEAVTLGQVFRFWQGEGSLPRKPIVLSFDDGNHNDVAVVAPLLHSIGWPGVLNLIVGTKPGDFARMRYWEVRTLVNAGWEIDAHTMTHPDLAHTSGAALAWEVGQSRIEIQRRLGVPADFFCYPSGRYDAEAIRAVRAAGYLGATTTDPGLAAPSMPFTLRRIRVSGGESLAGFSASIRAAR